MRGRTWAMCAGCNKFNSCKVRFETVLPDGYAHGMPLIISDGTADYPAIKKDYNWLFNHAGIDIKGVCHATIARFSEAGPHNRCKWRINSLITELKPKVIYLSGATVLKRMMGTTGIIRHHGKSLYYQPSKFDKLYLAVPIFSPDWLDRTGSDENIFDTIKVLLWTNKPENQYKSS